MTIQLDAKWDELVGQLVADGHYPDVRAVLDAAYEILREERESRDALRGLVDEAEREGGRISAEDILAESSSWFADLPDRR